MNKRGQGLSLTTIIVAAIALIVLVILVMIFTGRIGIFDRGVESASQGELVTMRLSYGDCRPGTAAENKFSSDLSSAGEDETLKDSYRMDFNRLVGDCKAKGEADCVSPCIWNG